MPDKHPYFQSSGHCVKLVTYLRRTFPPSVTGDTIKKLGLAPKNESYLVNTLRFLELIDDEGNKTDSAGKVFSLHQDDAFQKAFGDLVKKGYTELFKLHGDHAWELDTDSLISFFRQNDQSSAVVGRLQAHSFKTLSMLAGHGEIPELRKAEPAQSRKTASRVRKAGGESKSENTSKDRGRQSNASSRRQDFGLTVRIEINLPAEGEQETYDRIFKSIRENLLNE